jgi:hypothetical protein
MPHTSAAAEVADLVEPLERAAHELAHSDLSPQQLAGRLSAEQVRRIERARVDVRLALTDARSIVRALG